MVVGGTRGEIPEANSKRIPRTISERILEVISEGIIEKILGEVVKEKSRRSHYKTSSTNLW